MLAGTNVPYSLIFKADGSLSSKHEGFLEGDEAKLRERGINTPIVVRFPSMIVQSMKRLHDAFIKAANEANFAGTSFISLTGVFWYRYSYWLPAWPGVHQAE